ncbi:MAG: protein phosphatase CheZ [Bacteroidota bacterium]
MKNLNMSQLFDKLNDLKSLFLYGQKIVPILQSLIDFMQETVPLLENINNSIADSTAKIPKASNQINNVTSATELATTEILDLVDAISNSIDGVEKELSVLKENEGKKSRIMEKLKEQLNGQTENLALLEEYQQYGNGLSVIENTLQVFPKLKNDAYNITLSLQVQDITTQQLAAVNHLIESVQSRLASLILDIDETGLDDGDMSITPPQGATYDPNASYDKSESRQDMIDAIISKESQKTSQDEIDKLFG